jgi:hypothetical protein
MQSIQRGLFFYLLDTIHVFNLAALSATNNDYIQASYANQRLLGAANNIFATTLFDKYVCVDELYYRVEDIRRAQGAPVDLARFFYENMHVSKLTNTSLGTVCDFLSSCFGIEIERRCDVVSNMAIQETERSNQPRNPWASDEGKYLAIGLQARSKLSYEQESLLKTPNRSHDTGPKPRDRSLRELERYVYANTPIGHRFIFNDPGLATLIFSAVTDLIDDKKIKPQQIPLVHEQWTHCELNDLLKN